jgi:hypothetical protein
VTRTTARRPESSEAGNAPLELVILGPIIVLLICMVIGAGRLAVANGSISAAARAAAREASISRSPQQAQQAATAAADATLAQESLNCTPVVSVNAGALNPSTIGHFALVSARVVCRVSLSGLVLPGLPGHVKLSATFYSPVDPYRGRA